MKTLVCVNVLNSVSAWVYNNHIAFWCKTKEMYPSKDGHVFHFFTPPRMSIDMARNTAANEAIRRECDYLMFIDDDVLIPDTAFRSLVNCDADIAAGLVIIRGYPFNVMAFKKPEDGSVPFFNELPTIAIDVNGESINVLKDPITQDDGLAAVGFSCCLIKVDLLKKVPPPYFITGPRNTEDIYFCFKAADALRDLRMNQSERNGDSIEELKISMATHVQCGHLLNPEPIEYRTIDIFKNHFEDMFPTECNAIKEDTYKRDEEYIKRSLAKL